jgi:formamidopyrimidine-DNA glycosylase
MNQELIGHKVKGTEIFQPKNLNITIEEFMEKIMNRRILSVKERGKWLIPRIRRSTIFTDSFRNGW